MSDTVYQVVEKFLENKSIAYRYKMDMVERLFRGYTQKDIEKGKDKKLTPSTFAFLSQSIIKSIVDKTISDSDVQEAIGTAIKESVRSYTRDKNTAISVYKDFVSFIEEKYEINIPIEFPPTFSSEFDRQMYIVKELHEKGRDTSYLEEKLWVSDRTIEDDLAKLRSSTGVSIMGQRITVKGIERQKGNIEFESTVHPVLLALNLTQVVVMLQGLHHMYNDKAYKEYALKLAASIWNELSDYARRRIKHVTDALSMDLSWYEKLDSYRNENLFFTESECSYEEGAGNILDFLKNRKECAIEFKDKDGKRKILTNCTIRKYVWDKEEIEVISNGEKYTISINAIVKTRQEAKHLY